MTSRRRTCARQRSLSTYLFSLGNSDEGPVGFAANVIAASRREALAMLRAHFGRNPSKGFGPIYYNAYSYEEGVEYVEVHFRPDALRVKDIWDTEPL